MRITQMFPRLGVQRDYPEGENMIFFCDNNVEWPLAFNSLTMNCVRGSSSVPTAKTWRADIFPVQTEETKNVLKYLSYGFSNMKDDSKQTFLNQ